MPDSPLNPVSDGFISILRKALPEGIIAGVTPGYLEEPRGRIFGMSRYIARPRSTAEVAQIVKLCSYHRIGLIPYAGGTGLVAGQVKPQGPEAIILSVERLNEIRAIDTNENIIEVEAGVILADLQNTAKNNDRLFPLSLASEGSCRIGGNLATNAGGIQVLRYGNARALCLGIEAVMPDGSILNDMKHLHKDNTGYDLRSMLIGSEGTLGVITAASLKLFPVPADIATAFVAIPSPTAAVDLLGRMQNDLDGLVSGFELIDRQGLKFLAEKLPQIRQPFANPTHWNVLLEVGGGANSQIESRVAACLEQAFDDGEITNALIAQNEGQRGEFWHLREMIPQANRLTGAICSHDISVPVGQIPAFIEAGKKAISAHGDFRLNCFGHIGDGNLHYNIYPPQGKSRDDCSDMQLPISKTIYDLVHSFNGSISAEHGIGRLKTADLTTYGDPAKLSAMRMIKTALDPRGIMNPGVIFSQ